MTFLQIGYTLRMKKQMPKRRKLTPDLIKRITRYMLVETPLKPADLCFVFGTPHYPDNQAEQAADVYHRGLARRFVVSGAPRTDNGQREADRIADKMIELGVPSEIILREDRATNTGENVRYSMPLIDKKWGKRNIRSIIAVGKIYASRRYLMTLERWWPGRELMISPVNNFGVKRDKWFTNPTFRTRVISEWNKVPPYIKSNFIRETRPVGLPINRTPQPSNRVMDPPSSPSM
ncbi:MAG: YdcF family protein [Alphaproteobacteria bacterium]